MSRSKLRYNGYTGGEIAVRVAAVSVLVGGTAVVAAQLNSNPTTATYGFNVTCDNSAGAPTILSVDQQDMSAYTRDEDFIAVECGTEGTTPGSIELTDNAGDADITVVVRYHDGVLDSGAPTVTVGPGGVIGFMGDSTITNWQVNEG